MFKHTKALSLTIVGLLILTLTPGTSAKIPQTEPLKALSNAEAAESSLSTFSAASASSAVQADSEKRARVKATLNQLPLVFVENQGQLDEQVDYYVQGSDKTIYFTPEGVTYALTDAEAGERWTVKLDFVGANPDVRPVGEEKAETTISYFKGAPEEWHTGLPTYRRIVYEEVWPGIDLVYHGTVNRLKYAFIVQPSADPGQIRLVYRGAEVAANAAGQLEVSTPVGEFQDETPVAYQEVNGQRVPVSAVYALEGTGYGFELGAYDPNWPLILDPAVLVYCGYIGGSSEDAGWDIALDAVGNAYVVGSTESSESEGFPVAVGPDLSFSDSVDAFVAKVRAEGTGLDYCGYIGGSGSDLGVDIAVDRVGNAYVTGYTESSESEGFPVAVGPDLTFNNDPYYQHYSDTFVAKVTADGTSLGYCGYIGGSDDDFGYGIAVDGVGNAYVTGDTESSESEGFPVAVGPDLTFNDPYYSDAFVAKVHTDGTALEYCGYIGGLGSDLGFDIAVDGVGNAYVVGWTSSSETENFPVIAGPDVTYNGNRDVFVAKVTADGASLGYCGYIGSSEDDEGCGIAVDEAGKAYIAGTTEWQSAGFPVTVGPDIGFNGGWKDAFVARVSADGIDLEYCGYIGGSGSDLGVDIAVDGAGSAYVVGWTDSSESEGFPVAVGPDLSFSDSTDAFVAKVRAEGTGLDYCGYIGGSDYDAGYGIAVDGAGNAYVTGYTDSSESEGFPVTVGPDLTYNGNWDVFVAKISGEESGDVTAPSTISDLSASTGRAAGTVDLNWTAPGDDGNIGTAATYDIRYSDSSIVTPFGWEGATSVDGEPTPQPAGSSESMTVSGLTPGQTYYFAIRSQDEAGNRSGLSNSPSAVASDAPDLGFRPNPNGYQFANRQLSRNWEMFQQFFGSENVTHSDGSRCVAAEKFFQSDYLQAGDRWSCLGFSLTSLLSYLDRPQPNAGPFAIDHYEQLYREQVSAQLTDPIAYYSGLQTARQWADEYASWLDTCSTEPDEMIESIRRGMQDEEPVVLTLNTGTSMGWHTMAPYRVEDLSSTRIDVYVYDSEAPGQERAVSFEYTGDGWQWEYTFVGSLRKAGTVSGACTDMYPYHLETSLEQGEPPTDWCQSSAGTSANSSQTAAFSERVLAHLPVEGDWVIRDSLGRRLGWVDGERVSEIPDAYHVPQVLGSASISYRILYLPEGEYTVEINDSPDEAFGYTVFGDGRFVEMSGHLRSVGSDASLSMDPDLDRVTLFGVHNLTSFGLALDNESTSESRLATLAGTPLSGAGDLETNFDGNQVTISRAPGDVEYNLMLRKSEGQLFVSEPLNVEFNDTHVLSPISWDELDSTSVILEIDEDSDGTVDETQVLENKAKRVYLPLVMRNH